jgi:hypothetical protein
VRISPPRKQRPLVAWTRYPGGRWRATLRGSFPDEMVSRATMLFGVVAEVVILQMGQEPGGCASQTSDVHRERGGLVTSS